MESVMLRRKLILVYAPRTVQNLVGLFAVTKSVNLEKKQLVQKTANNHQSLYVETENVIRVKKQLAQRIVHLKRNQFVEMIIVKVANLVLPAQLIAGAARSRVEKAGLAFT